MAIYVTEAKMYFEQIFVPVCTVSYNFWQLTVLPVTKYGLNDDLSAWVMSTSS